jgi:hypothetical protein
MPSFHRHRISPSGKEGIGKHGLRRIYRETEVENGMCAVKPLEGTRIIAQFDGESGMIFPHMTKPRKSTSFEIHLEPIRNEPIRNEEIRNEPIRLDEIPCLEIRNDPIHSEPIQNAPIPVIDLGG